MKFLVYFSLLITIVFGNEFRIKNNCPYTVWPGLTGNPGFPHPEGGGFELKSKQTHSTNVQKNWQGRIWGRTNCGSNGHCQTGDCGAIKCSHWGTPPATLAEFGLNGWGNQDFYDISQVDGFNIPMRIVPIAGTFKKAGNGHYDCNPINCNADVNGKCPSDLAIKANGKTIACQSACTKWRSNELYCCTGAHNKRETCHANQFPHNYPGYFKGMCPDAYSWAFDDSTSIFTCHGTPQTGYEIIFCP